MSNKLLPYHNDTLFVYCTFIHDLGQDVINNIVSLVTYANNKYNEQKCAYEMRKKNISRLQCH